jgi:hypothetical protein
LTAELAAIALACIAGLPLARRLDREANNSTLIGEALLLGFGLLAAVLFCGLWSRLALIVVALLPWIRVPRPLFRPGPKTNAISVALLVAAALLMIGYATYATMAPPPELDYLADWGAKGRVFFEAGGIDWRFLETAGYRATHPDYPLLVPLTFDVVALLRSGWSDAALGLINVVFATALLLIVFGLAEEETPWAAFIVLAIMPLAALPWIGIGDGPFVAYVTAALLLLRRGRDDIGAVLLGLAASTKNEGLALIAAVALALVAARRAREIIRLWPAVMIALPWLVLRSLHHIGNDVTSGGAVVRIFDHLRDPIPLLAALASSSSGRPLFWIGIAMAVVIGVPRLRQERFALTAIAMQLLFYIGAYLASPHDVGWHVRWSWERLVAHLTPALTYVVLQALVARQDTITSTWRDRSKLWEDAAR